MPTKDQHYKKSKKNIEFYEDIVNTHPDWAMTGLFYAALHLVDSFLATKQPPDGIHPEKHLFRTKVFNTVSELRNLYPHYRALEDFGHKARYTMNAFTSKSADEAHTRYFKPIKEEIDRLLETR
jgi:hypothetical protein